MIGILAEMLFVEGMGGNWGATFSKHFQMSQDGKATDFSYVAKVLVAGWKFRVDQAHSKIIYVIKSQSVLLKKYACKCILKLITSTKEILICFKRNWTDRIE